MRNQMVMDNIPMVNHVIKLHGCYHSEYDDMFQQGVETLIRAADKFDPKYGARFSTYAFTALRRAFVRMSKQDRVIRMPTHLPVDDEKVINKVLSYETWSNLRLPELMQAVLGKDVMEEKVTNKLLIEDALEVLNDNERTIIKAKYYDDKPLRELVKDFGISRQRLHFIEKTALKKMRDVLCEY